ncbi:hypothetical protein [Roseibium sp.]|uniref:hypothetical protein n=1 Tax=Roseibium sp. TaxID=1936156 RepID=UPI003B503471
MAMNTLPASIDTNNTTRVNRRTLLNGAAATVAASVVGTASQTETAKSDVSQQLKLEMGDGYRFPTVTPVTVEEWEVARMVSSLFDKSLNRARKFMALEMIRRSQDLIDMGVDVDIWVQRNRTV